MVTNTEMRLRGDVIMGCPDLPELIPVMSSNAGKTCTQADFFFLPQS